VARGAFVSRDAAQVAGDAERQWPQRAVGVDAAFSLGHFGARGEIRETVRKRTPITRRTT
jgi:hypothetical protein